MEELNNGVKLCKLIGALQAKVAQGCPSALCQVSQMGVGEGRKQAAAHGAVALDRNCVGHTPSQALRSFRCSFKSILIVFKGLIAAVCLLINCDFFLHNDSPLY